ncbi:MAG: TlpA family protein disulfide reductase [bacterium]|nr:TlpA family protein disulfide reductase [bacterium]
MELPRLQPLWEEYKEQGFEVVAVEEERDTERATQFIEENNLTYTLVENGESENEIVRSLFGVNSFPTSFLIDRQGRIIYAHVGFEKGDEEKIEKEIQSLL